MNDFSIDFESLQGALTKKKAYKLSDVKDRIRKIAFDVVKFMDSDKIDGLWQIEHTKDGDYIVAMYEDGEIITAGAKESGMVKSSAAKDWNVISDKSGQNLNFFYKGAPIVRLATASLGIPLEEASLAVSYLPEKLATNSRLVSGLLQEVSPEERKELLTKYPELNK